MYHRPFYKAATPLQDVPSEQTTWQQQLGCAISDIDALHDFVGLPKPDAGYQPRRFGLKVPHAYARKMVKGDPHDPLLLQVLPDIAETQAVAGYTTDPLDEAHHNPTKGLLHKYRSRVLITLTGACAVHCRYCFRQHFDYGANLPAGVDLASICDYIGTDDAINEVLLSGGDPLSVSTRKLALWLDALAALPNIKTVRLHTRLPVVLPSRVDDELIALFGWFAKNLVMVLHINHANEIDDELADKCQALKQAGVVLLNQTVLLKRVNDDADALAQLSHRLFDVGILPYYLHVLDKVAGAAHFDVERTQAVAIYWQLLEKLSGYLVPKLVQELPDKPYKVPIDLYQYAR